MKNIDQDKNKVFPSSDGYSTEFPIAVNVKVQIEDFPTLLLRIWEEKIALSISHILMPISNSRQTTLKEFGFDTSEAEGYGKRKRKEGAE